MRWEKELFYRFIIENKIIGFFEKPLKLKSGRLSYFYVNWRNITEDVFLIDVLTDFILSFVKNLNLNLDCFYGVPEGGTKLGLITQYKWTKSQTNYAQGIYSLSMGRAKPKEHGDPKDRLFLGVPDGNVIVLEDTITTGGSLIETLKKLLELDIKVICAIGLTNRNEFRDDGKSVETYITKMGVPFYSMSNALDLLPIAYSKFHPSELVAKKVEDYFRRYGIRELHLI